MKVSVLVSFHNHEALVRRVAESALSQDFDDYEVVFVDDASTDGSYAELEKVIREFKGFRGRNVKCLRNEKNLGIVGTFNRLMAESVGELCVVHCGDDVAHPNRVSEIVRCWDEAVREHPNIVFAQTKCKMVDADLRTFGGTTGSGTGRWRVEKGTDALERHFLFHGAAATYSRKLFDRFGPMDPAARAEDSCMFYRAAISGDILLIDEALFDYRCVLGSSTAFHRTLEAMAASARREVEDIRQQMCDLDAARPAGQAHYAEELVRRLATQQLFLKLLTARGEEKRRAGTEVVRRALHDPSMRRFAVFALPRPIVSAIVWLRGTIGNLRWRSRVRRLEKLLDFKV